MQLGEGVPIKAFSNVDNVTKKIRVIMYFEDFYVVEFLDWNLLHEGALGGVGQRSWL